MERKTAQSKPNNLVQTIERVSLILEMVGQSSQGMSIGTCLRKNRGRRGVMNEILHVIENCGIVPVVKIEKAEDALPLGKALCAGGLPLVEITFRTVAAEEVQGLVGGSGSGRVQR